MNAVIAGLGILALTPLLSFYTLDIQKIYPGHPVWGRSVVRLAIAALLYFLKPRRIGKSKSRVRHERGIVTERVGVIFWKKQFRSFRAGEVVAVWG